MKKYISTPISWQLILGFALVLSCSEQDEPVNQATSDSDSYSSSEKTIRKNLSGKKKGAPLDGTVGDPISLNTAKKWKANHKTRNPHDILGHFFGNEIIQQILDEPGCVGIRMYYALDDDGNKQILLVGVDADGEDLLPADGGSRTSNSNIIADASFPCPDYCPSKAF